MTALPRRLAALTDDTRLVRRGLAWWIVTAALQGAAFALLLPLLRTLFAGDLAAAGRWTAALAVTGAIWAAAYAHATATGYRTGLTLGRDVRRRLGDKLRTLPLGWFTTSRTGELARTMASSAMTVMSAPAHLLEKLVTAAVTPTVVIIVTLFLDPVVAAVPTATFAATLLAAFWAGRVARPLLARHDATAAEAGSRFIEYAHAQPTLRAAGRAGEGHARLTEAMRDHHRAYRRLLHRMTVPIVTVTAFVQAGIAAVLAIAVWRATGGLAAADVAVLMLFATRVAEPLLLLALHATETRDLLRALDRVDAVLHESPLPPARCPAVPAGHDIVLDGVTFAYGDRPVLRDVHLTIPEGGTTALIGGSGAGKSTLARLIARFHDVTGGSVRIGGVDVRDIPEAELTARISIVFQDAYLFDDTIEANVRLGRPGATGAELAAAATAARLDELIARLPDGWDTRVGEGGTSLSGGERRRVSIARALLKDAPIVLLDEPTASLDAENDTAVHEALAALAGAGRTLVVIAHRLSTIERADQIAVLADGRIVQRGRHGELVAAPGAYREFWGVRERAAGWRVRG